MKKYRYARLAIGSASSAIAFAFAVPAVAASEQDSSPPVAEAPQDASVVSNAEAADIVVSGIRGSMQRNMDIKRAAPGVVDAISAEDIGKFPDSNIADSLQRLPGLSIQRSGARGDATGVSVRGFGGDFNETLFDGRHISTATGGRSVDFTTIGSDFVGRLSVYKTPDVELGVSAIGATLDVSLPKPFDKNGLHFVALGSGSVQNRSGKLVPAGGALISDTFADDTIGILADVTYSRRDTTSNQVGIPGWVGNYFYQCQLTAACTSDDLVAANKTVLGWFPQQLLNTQQSTQDERISGRIAFQWEPSDGMLLTIDDNFTRQDLHTQAYSAGVWFNGDDLRNIKQDANGTVTDFTQFGSPMDFIAYNQRQVNQTNQLGANLKWEATDKLKFDFDASLSKSWLNPGNNGREDRMDIGYGGTNTNPPGPFVSTGCSGTPNTCTNYSTVLGAPTGVTINGPSSDNLPSIHDFGPAGNAAAFTDQTLIGSHVIQRRPTYNTDTVKQFRVAGAWEGDNFKLKFGAQYMEDKFHQEMESDQVNGTFLRYAGYGEPSGRSGGIAPLPASIYQGTISTSNFIPGYTGTVLPSLIKFDPYATYAFLESTGGGTTLPAFDPSSVLNVTEKTWSAFFKASFDVEVGDMPFHLTAGLRDENVSVTSSAIGRLPVALEVSPNDPSLLQVSSFTPDTVFTAKNSYNYLLPSFDAKLEVTDKLVLRFDASRTLTRPQLTLLKPTISMGTLRKGSLTASTGNPNLKPYLSDNFDIAAEYYYARNSYFAVDAFLKNISNFIVGGVKSQTVNNVIDPNTNQAAVFLVNSSVNGPDGTVKGVEIAWQQVFGDSGFGFNANATLVKTNRKFDASDISGSAFAITGLANSANFVGFYDKNGIEARVAMNWRDSYLLQIGQAQGGTFGAEPVHVNSQLQIDASASYDINEHFTVFVEGTNLNNSTFSTYGRWSNQPLDIWSYGRRFVFGARLHY